MEGREERGKGGEGRKDLNRTWDSLPICAFTVCACAMFCLPVLSLSFFPGNSLSLLTLLAGFSTDSWRPTRSCVCFMWSCSARL